MGASVGSSVGAPVVGASVGASVGDSVGASVGASVGNVHTKKKHGFSHIANLQPSQHPSNSNSVGKLATQ